jgi:hypothetical protein
MALLGLFTTILLRSVNLTQTIDTCAKINIALGKAGGCPIHMNSVRGTPDDYTTKS